MAEIEKANNQIVSEITGLMNKYFILNNGDVMVVTAKQTWCRVDEIKNLKGNMCVKLWISPGTYEYFLKEDLINGIVRPLARSEVKRRKNEKAVMQYKDGVLINTFQNANIASRETGTTYAGIYNCCNNLKYCKSAGGFEWCYK
jgi:hypothetical protein